MFRSPALTAAAAICAALLASGLPSAEPDVKEPAKPEPGGGGGFFLGDGSTPDWMKRPRARKVPVDHEELFTPAPDPVTAEIVRREEAARQAFRRARIIDIDETFENVPLREVIEDLIGKLEMPARIDEQALRDAGVRLEEAVTLSFKDVTLSEAFDELADRYDIAIIRLGRRAAVTSLDIADESLQTQFYPVGDLTITTRKDGRRFHDAEPLIEFIEQTTSGPWFHIDGVGGTLAAYDAGGLHLLAVRTTAQVHEKTEELLYRLRQLRRPKGGEAPAAK